jgi:hypothetical protein
MIFRAQQIVGGCRGRSVVADRGMMCIGRIQNSKRANLQLVHFRVLEIRVLNLFRISNFELRISEGKLDHIVNFVVVKKT